MGEPFGSGSGPGRPRSVSPVSQPDVNVFDDEFAEDYAESVIAPSIRGEDPFADPSPEPPNRSEETLTLTPTTSQLLPLSDQSEPSQRESIRKSRGGVDNNDPFLRGSLAHRTNSSSSLAPPLSPTDDGNGPSHPYAMYPQIHGVSRTASLATASTYRSPSLRSGSNRQAPTHPYALYPQDVFGDSSDSGAAIPVGFPGHRQEFHRRLGAEGEEQDIIGPDGHGEQLPPYTRYPEAAVTRAPTASGGALPNANNGASLPRIGESSQSTDNLVEISQETTPQNPFSSPADPPTQQSNEQSAQSTSTAQSTLSEKSWKEKTWKEKRRHKLFGLIPLWIMLLSFAVIVFIVAICAGVIAGYVQAQSSDDTTSSTSTKPPSQPQTHQPDMVTSTYWGEGQPLTTGTATIAPLPTGTFTVPFTGGASKYDACLDKIHSNAWSCELPPDENVTIAISHKRDKWYLDTITESRKNVRSYGTQPPELSRESLRFVIDADAEKLGAAYHFQAFYDKLVVLPFDWILTSSDLNGILGRLSRRAYPNTTIVVYPTVASGDKAWFCEWDDTFIEGFIYVTEVLPPMSSTVVSPGTYLFAASTTQSRPPVQTVSSTVSSAPTSPPIELAVNPTESDTDEDNDDYEDAVEDAIEDAAEGDADPPWDDFKLARLRERGAESSIPSSTETLPPETTSIPPPAPTASYIPKMIKFEERRIEGLHPQPVCTLVYMQEDGFFAPLPDSNEQVITIILPEDDARVAMAKYRYRMNKKDLNNPNKQRRGGYEPDLSDTCYCQWTSYGIPLDDFNVGPSM